MISSLFLAIKGGRCGGFHDPSITPLWLLIWYLRMSFTRPRKWSPVFFVPTPLFLGFNYGGGFTPHYQRHFFVLYLQMLLVNWTCQSWVKLMLVAALHLLACLRAYMASTMSFVTLCCWPDKSYFVTNPHSLTIWFLPRKRSQAVVMLHVFRPKDLKSHCFLNSQDQISFALS